MPKKPIKKTRTLLTGGGVKLKKNAAPAFDSFDFCDDIQTADGETAVFSVREKLFVFHYLTDAEFEAVKAAELAGYNAKNQNSLRVIACNVMKRARVREAINAGLESLTMPKFENLYRLAAQAKGNINDVLDDDGNLSIEKARANGSIGLIQQIEITETIDEVKREAVDTPADLNLSRREREKEILETTVKTRKVKFKMYSAFSALKVLTEINFARRHELTGADGAELVNAGTVLILPDNGRADSPAALQAAGQIKAAAKKTGSTKPGGIKSR